MGMQIKQNDKMMLIEAGRMTFQVSSFIALAWAPEIIGLKILAVLYLAGVLVLVGQHGLESLEQERSESAGLLDRRALLQIALWPIHLIFDVATQRLERYLRKALLVEQTRVL